MALSLIDSSLLAYGPAHCQAILVKRTEHHRSLGFDERAGTRKPASARIRESSRSHVEKGDGEQERVLLIKAAGASPGRVLGDENDEDVKQRNRGDGDPAEKSKDPVARRIAPARARVSPAR
jgi:hypothetical protein